MLSNDRLEQIAASDVAAGENLQLCPVAWQERRELLQHVKALHEVGADADRLVRQLDVLLNGEDGAAQLPRLCDMVAQVQRWITEGRIMTDAVAARMQQVQQPDTPRWMDYGSLDNGLCSYAVVSTGAACRLAHGHVGGHEV